MRDRSTSQFRDAQRRPRALIREGGDFSIPIDETRREDMRQICGLLARSFNKVYLYDACDMDSTSTNAEAFLGIIRQFLNGKEGDEPSARDNCIQNMGDKCNTLLSIKNRASAELGLQRLYGNFPVTASATCSIR